MRVLQLLDERWDSGLTDYALKIAALLSKGGDEICVGVHPGKKPETMAKDLGLDTVSVTSVFDLKKLLSRRRFDLINVHTGTTHTWAVISQLFKNSKSHLPIVRTRGDARALKINFLSRFVYSHTAAIIAASEHIRKQYELGFGFNEESARTIYPSVQSADSPTFLPKNKVGILGRLDPVKGHLIFLEAASHVLKKTPDVEFLIGGKESNITYQSLRNFARELGIENQIQFMGYQNSAQEFMRASSIGVVASIGSEEVSRVCLEWMSQGRPLIGTIVGCIAELVEPLETGLLVPPGNSKALAEAILALLQEPALARKLGVNAHRVVKTRFNDEVFIEKTRRAYNWALAHFSPK